ncbi:NACHT and WD40 repeat domain-containing protein, partial [Okeania hirsuta]|uniref:NACHT and WD40 repeat domain-containing protein n=1 Tax=Okeania hirsuta TaxID=1458930 RepID=UPI001864F779
MNPEPAFDFVNNQYLNQKGKSLSDLQKNIFCLAWENEKYGEIAIKTNFAEGYIRQEAANLWKILGDLFGQKITCKNFRGVVETEFQKHSDRLKFPLPEQMKEWFKILGYQFAENYNVVDKIHGKRFFEWIIKVKTRRGYDRILVRGVEGEAATCDLNALRQSVAKEKTDEGWLVAVRRISKAARHGVEKEENQNLFCYTFDELLDQEADFERYFQWLEKQVKQRGIDKKYVPLACRKEEVDPDTKQKIGVSDYEEADGWIDGYIDKWLDDPVKKHLSVLGEFGTGKTWFVFHYAWQQLQKYLDAKKRGVERPRLPIIILLRDYAKAVNMESLFSEFFFRQHEIPLPGYSAFELLNRMGKLLVIFDGFDEMAARVDRQKMINNFWELAQTVVPGAKVILTCRTEHFPEAQEGRALLNAELQASVANLTGEPPQFEVLELKKFNDEQIRQVLSFNTEPSTVEKVMNNSQLLDLARRPVMSELILAALPEIEKGKAIDLARIYLYAVTHKMQGDIKEERTFTSLADKLYFLCELSWEMLSNDRMSLNYREFPDRIRRLFESRVQEQRDLDHWHYDMMGQTILIRNEDGDYSPAHRSMLEFFVAYKFAAELGVLVDDFVEVARMQSHVNLEAMGENCTWSEYFRREVDAKGGVISIPPLNNFSRECLENLRSTLGKMPLTKAVLDLLLPMLRLGEGKEEKQNVCGRLREVLEGTRGKTAAEVGYVGGNAATLLVRTDKLSLAGSDLRNLSIYPNFTKAIALSPNLETLATVSTDRMTQLWNVSNGKCLATLQGDPSWFNRVTFSPSGEILATGGKDKNIRLWNVANGEYLATLSGHEDSLRCLAFRPDGKVLASGAADFAIKLWDITDINNIPSPVTIPGHENEVRWLAFSPDGKVLA